MTFMYVNTYTSIDKTEFTVTIEDMTIMFTNLMTPLIS